MTRPQRDRARVAMPTVHIHTDSTWSHAGRTRARGHASLDGRSLAAVDIAAALDAAGDAGQWTRLCARMNGGFAAITQTADGVRGGVDRLRTIPLFHLRRGDELHLADRAATLVPLLPARAADGADVLEFLLTGYTTGARTLLAGLAQVRAGHVLHAGGDDTQPVEQRYYAFRPAARGGADTAALVERLHALHAEVFGRLLQGTAGRPLAVPLSGGYDSRLIVVMLRELGARDVTCYTYGVPGNWEAEISRELARHLGLRWEFVAYDSKQWQQWARDDALTRYLEMAGNAASVPHVQDWPAIRALLARGAISPEAVVVPGHSGDFLAGSHIPPALLDAADDLDAAVEATLARHYVLWDWPRDDAALRDTLRARIRDIVCDAGADPRLPASAAFEQWDLEERQAKFICNSMRAYEFAGLDWRLPLFDYALMDFWCGVPLEWRYRRRLYFDYVAKHQRLPVRMPNTDRTGIGAAAVAAASRLGLRSAGKALRRAVRRTRWRREWASSSHAPLAWLAAVDRDLFRRTYTGNETLHSYMALRYLAMVLDAQTLRAAGVPGA